MSVWDNMKEALITAGKKTKVASEIAKLKLDIRSKKDFVERQYKALGMEYYAAHKNDEGSDERGQFHNITEALEEIERMKGQTLMLKGAAECPKCGAKTLEGTVFCSSCGARMDDILEEIQARKG